MRKAYSGFYLCSVLLLLAIFVNIGCGDGGGSESVTNSDGGGVQPGVAEKQMIIEGPIPNEIAENTAIPVPGAPSGIERAAEFGNSKEFSIAVIDRDDPAMAKELAPVVIETSENSVYRYKYRTVINIETGKKTPFIAIKSKILNKVVLSSIPGQVPSYSEVPKDVKKIHIKGVLIDAETTARAVLANDNKMSINVPVIALSNGEQSQEVVVRVLGNGDKLPVDTVIENNAGGVSVVREMAKAVEAIKTVLVTAELTSAEKSAVFENTREKRVVPSAAGVISDYVLTIKNLKIQQKASELNIPVSITLGGTKIDGRSTVAVIDGGAGNIAGADDNEPPAVTSVTITPKTVKVGDELQLAFTTSKLLILPPVVIINDRKVEAVKVDTNTYKAVTSVLGSDPKEVTFKIDNLVGENGKPGQSITEVTDGSKPKVEEGVTAVQPPVFDPPTGIYKTAKIVSVYSKTPGCEIYYTLDGGEPTAAYGSRYESPVTVGTDTTIKAVAVFNGTSSIVNQASYVISLPVARVEAPVFSFAGGSFSKSQSVAISCETPGASIKYTLDGSVPSKTNGMLCSAAILIDKQMVLKAAAIKDGMQDSTVTTAVYDVNIAKETAPAPVFNPAPGAFIAKQSVAIVSAVEGALIKYTLDGTTPSYDNGFIYSEPISIMEPTGVKAVVIKDGMQDSAIVSGLFDVNIVGPVLEPVAPPVFSPQEGRYTNYSEFKVKIITPFKDAKIIYTTDGTTPGADNGEIYSGPVLINKSTAFKAVALKDKMLDSEVVSAFYEIRNDNAPPAPPVISGVKDGAITPYEVSLFWNEQEGVESFAAIVKDNIRSDYSKSSILSEEGSYTLEVSVRKTANNTTNKSAIAFVIDKSLPVVPAVIGIATDEISAKPVVFFWQDALWTKTTAKLAKEGGLKSDYSKGYEISENGSYVLEITSVNEKNGLIAHDSLPFKIDSTVPEVPAITGVVDNAHNASDVAADWEDMEGVTLTAELSGNGGTAVVYERKASISEEGSYTLKLTAKKNDTGTLNSRSVSFVIDKAEPAEPLVSGVKDGEHITSEVRITWDENDIKAPSYGPERNLKTAYRAEISKDGGKPERYLKNSVISAAGSYVITVTAVKPNRLKKETVIKFMIDKNLPDVPFISVVDEDGESVVSWEEQPGIEYLAKLTRDGGDTVDYALKTHVKQEGNYKITVTARDVKSGLVSKSTVAFNRVEKRTLVAPEAPRVRGIEDGAVAGYDVSLTWQDVTSVLTYGRLKKDNGEFKEYSKGASINEDGFYIFELEAEEPKTQMSSKRTISFAVDKKAPAAPVITGVKDGESAGGELKLSWNEQDSCETTARITKSGVVTTVQTQAGQNGAGQNQDILELTSRLMMNNDPYFLYRYTHEYDINFDRLEMAMKPILDKNRMLAKQLRYYYEQQLQQAEQTASTTTSTQSYIESAYEKNSSIIENGEYILEVTALKKYNGLKAVSRVKFTLDQNEPAVPVLTGIDNEAVTSENVTIKWEKSEGVNYLAKLLKDSDTTLLYESGSPITLAGSYYLEVTATNKSNGKTSSASRKFKIDRSVPAIPELIGAKDGDYTAKDITISWQDASGHSSSAAYSKDGSKETAYKKGDTLSAEGYYKFKITVKNSVTGISNSKTIGFTIDRKAPEVPEFAGFTYGAVYSGPVSISWLENQNFTYKATITRNNDANGEYSKGAVLTDDGDYYFTLSAIKPNELSSATTAVFIIDKTSPAAPVIDLVNKTTRQQPSAPSYGGAIVEKSPLNGPTVISWNEQQGCQTTASLSKNGGAAAVYLKNTEISEDGKYVIEVTAKKLSNGLSSKATMRFSRMPDGFYSGPVAPKISGALEGSVNAKAVTLSWQEEDGVAYYAALSKDGGDPMEISNGTVVSKNGKYSLEVKAEKKSNGLANRSTLSFTMDALPPDMPSISGVRVEAVYASGVKASWKEAPGVFYSAYLAKDGEQETVSYGNGFPITQDGRYKLMVQAVKMSNNLDSKTELSFTIDQTPPDAPVISGVEDNATVSKGVKLEWKEVSGVKTTALISKDGGNPKQFSNGGSISINGSYRVEVTAVKISNGLKSSSVINFTINTEAPAKPAVSGVTSGRGYTTPVSANWEDQAGAVTKALLYAPGASAPVDYIKGTPISYNGLNRLVVTALAANGSINETNISFVINTVPPQAPALSVVSKDEGVYVGWNEIKSASYSARLSKKGGQPEYYTKGALITEDGEYTLELTVKSVYEGAFKFADPLFANASITFTKSGAKALSGPAAPVISGAANGVYYNKPVSLLWEEIAGAKTSALLTKFGNTPAAYEKGSSISADGSYVLEVSAVSDVNKMSSKSSVAFVIDTTRPAASLSYGANPAGEGLMRITAAFTEVLAEGSAVKINIDQPGSEDIKNASMTRDQSSPAVWYYDYYVNTSDGSKYIDGVASVSLSEVFDPAGNAAQTPANASFVINTSSPVSSITYSFVPAVPDAVETQSSSQEAPLRLRGSETNWQSNTFRQGKLTLTVIFSKDVKNGVTPEIYIDQPGSQDIKDRPMKPGNNRRVWTYEYNVNADNGRAYIDGKATVSISQTSDEFGKIFAQPANRYFTIDTKAPSVELLYSANPARSGKLTITAKYSEPPMSGYVPYITIFQQGSYELSDAAMQSGSSSSVWTYDYYIKGDESGEFADGRAVVVLSSVTDAAGNISKRPYNQTFLVGTKIPNYAVLSYSANPAGGGRMRITATFNEDYSGAIGPRISIDQQGKADVQRKWMEPGVNKKIWFYDYVINDNNGADFMDGKAAVVLSDETNAAIDIIDGNTFTIDTTPPAVQLLSLNDTGLKLVGGSDYTIKWSASDSEGMAEKPVSVSFYNGLSWATVEAGLENTGFYVWKVPSLDIAAAKISVSAVDKVGNRASAASANSFAIVSSGPSWNAGYPKIEAISVMTAKLSLKANRSGKIYFMLIPSSANIENVPSDNVKAGILEGVSVAASGAKDIVADKELSLEITGLSPGIEYRAFIVMQDALGIIQKAPAVCKVLLDKIMGIGGGVNPFVFKLVTDGRGNMYAAGHFTRVGVVQNGIYSSSFGTSINRIAKWNGAGWQALGSGVSQEKSIMALAMDSKGNLYAGGYFSEIGGVKVNGLAKWDGFKWSALGDGIGFDDTLKAGIQRNINANGYVNSIAVDSKDNVYVGGNFNLAGKDKNDISANCVAMWDGYNWHALGDGALTKSTTAPYTISGGQVICIAVDKSDNVYIGGAFNYAASSNDGKYIAKWDGEKWHTLGAGMNERVLALTVGPDGGLYAGGWFTKAGDVTANYIAKWNGSSWEALGSGFDNWVYDIKFDSRGVLYAAGNFIKSGGYQQTTNAAGSIFKRIAKWDNAKWLPVGADVDNLVVTMDFDIDGGLYIGGIFKKVNEVAAWAIAKINP